MDNTQSSAVTSRHIGAENQNETGISFRCPYLLFCYAPRGGYYSGMLPRVKLQNTLDIRTKSFLKLEYTINDKKVSIASGNIPALQPYEKTAVTLAGKKGNEEIEGAGITVTIHSGKNILSTLEL